MDEELKEQEDNRKSHLWKKGQSGNPKGRPVGSKTMKTWVKERLLAMNDEERDEFLAGIPKVEIWKLAEGNPHQTTDTKVTLPNNLIDIFNATSNKATSNGIEGEDKI